MATTHMNLPILPTGAVDGISQFNNAMNILEYGRTIKVTVGTTSTLVKTTPFYVNTDGLAYKAYSTTEQFGLWQSASNSSGTVGYGQIEGYMNSTLWNWTPKSLIYVDSSGNLSTVCPGPNNKPIALAFSSRNVIINPTMKTKINYKIVTVTVSSGNTTAASSTDAELENGIILGYIPTTADQVVKNINLTVAGAVEMSLAAASATQSEYLVTVMRSL